MKTILTHICIIVISASLTTQQQYAIHSNVQPVQDEYIRLSEIPFENAVRAISTPPRDHVPIHEHQHDIPPPPRPQPVQNQNQALYNPYNPTQSYVTPGYNNVPNGHAPMSFQYMALSDYPNEIYNLLYHTNSGGGGGYLQRPYNPFDIPGQHSAVQHQIPSTNTIVIPQNIKIVPSYNHIQGSLPSDFKPSLQIHPGITELSVNKQYFSSFPLSRFKKAKTYIQPNLRYASNIPNVNGFIPSKNYPIRTSRMIGKE